MPIQTELNKLWEFLKKDSWQSWLVSIIIIIIIIKFVFFPVLSLITGTKLPLVVVESCSMYHESSFNGWWEKNAGWYEPKNISKEEFTTFPMNNGLNKGDIIIVLGNKNYKKGDIIIFTSSTKYPIIHRIMSQDPLATKGDHNTDQLNIEKEIPQNAIVGKAVGRIPLLGWIKLIFFEPLKDPSQQGFCK